MSKKQSKPKTANTEATMNIQIIAALSTLGLGFLLLLASKLIRKPLQKPILIETRQIIRRKKSY